MKCYNVLRCCRMRPARAPYFNFGALLIFSACTLVQDRRRFLSDPPVHLIVTR